MGSYHPAYTWNYSDCYRSNSVLRTASSVWLFKLAQSKGSAAILRKGVSDGVV
jgi:hypothetical protein